MVRTREFDPAAALTSAMEIFAARGYKNTSIDDVVKATGVSRYGIYGTFGNKRELFEQALEKYAEHMGKAAFLRLLEPDATLRDIRVAFTDRIDHMLDCGGKSGCLLTFAAMEVAPRDKEIEAVLHRFMMRMTKAFMIGLEHAREKGETRESLDLDRASEFLTGAFFGLTVMGRSGFSRESLYGYVDSTLSAVAR